MYRFRTTSVEQGQTGSEECTTHSDLTDKVAIVTGASMGIGKAIATEFTREGAFVLANYNKSILSAQELQKEFRDRLTIFKADVAERKDVDSMVDFAVSRFGKLDILVNNAGIMKPIYVENYLAQPFHDMWNTNFMGTLHATIASIPHLRRTKGCIINLASNAGIGTDTPTKGSTFYAITKAAVIMLTKRSALELGHYGIRVNAIAPGWVKTEGNVQNKTEEEVSQIESEFENRTFLRMVGNPLHIAKLATFLASMASEFVTGQVIVADGGRNDNITHGV